MLRSIVLRTLVNSLLITPEFFTEGSSIRMYLIINTFHLFKPRNRAPCVSEHFTKTIDENR
jgi:hypothetical protein